MKMRTLFMNFKIFLHLWQYFTSVINKLLCFIKKRKLSTDENKQTISTPTSIQIQGDKCEEIQLVDWNTWGDDGLSVQEELTEKEIAAEELFKDMEPVINKAKVVHVTKKVKPAAQRNMSNSPFAFQSRHSNITNMNNTGSHRINFNAQYQVETELGTWDDDDDDEASGWDNGIDDNEINKQTENMIKETKQIEREKRAEEQKKKRLEKELQRSQRKQESIGIKIS